MSQTDLDRREGEGTRDYFLRLMRDPMCEGVPLAEVAHIAGITPKRAREYRGDELAMTLAAQVAEDVGWTELNGTLADLVIAALTDYADAACEDGRCTHALCARERREKAIDEARQRLRRTARETRFQPARHHDLLPARDPGHQSRGALPGRTGGGA